MKVGDRVALSSHNGFCGFGTISKVGIPSGLDNRTCYELTEGSRFFMKPELGTGRYYNVGNKAFWITRDFIGESEPK